MQGEGSSAEGNDEGRLSAADILVDEEAAVAGERASILHAAMNARNAAMLTGTHGVVAAPLDRPFIELPKPGDLLDPAAGERTGFIAREGEPAVAALLRARAEAAAADPVARCRALVELAYVEVDAGRDEAARAAAEEAAAAVPESVAAHALLRALTPRRAQAKEQLVHVEHLIVHVSDDLARADLLTEKARLLEAIDGSSDASIGAYREALALVADHPGALAGLESALDASKRAGDLAAHLGRLAGLSDASSVAAWLHVERATLLDRRLGEVATARGALERALELAPQIGPVRQACVDHAVLHRDDRWLSRLLAGEAAQEPDRARAAGLELDAALAALRAGEHAEAVKLLESAHGRAPTSSVVDARVASELARLLEKDGCHADALRVLDASLRVFTEPREEALALRAVATAAERAGVMDRAVLALERARVLDADDPTVLEELDRLLARAARHEQRAVLWMREAALLDDPVAKTRALLLAAQASSAAGREADAARYREVAWVTDPSAPGVFDSLAERLAPSATREVVAARVALYEQAAERTRDEGQRLWLREKIAWLWDDVAGDAALAAKAYEDVLEIEGARRSAIAGLASSATRARDGKKLSRALLAEAAVLGPGPASSERRLRAAEALAEVDGERALALASELVEDAHVASRARELVTTIHRAAGRWELVARSLDERGRAETSVAKQVALALAEAEVLSHRLGAPHRALRTLEAAREKAKGDPAVALALVAAVEATGDRGRLREELERLAEDGQDPAVRVRHLVRAAELAESQDGGDDDAVRLYARAREAMPDEAFVVERLKRLGARASVPAEVVPALLSATRRLDADADVERSMTEELLASGARDVATLRVAERIARRARSAPQLANALALEVATLSGISALRALSALSALVTWTLPEAEGLEPWDRLLALGSRDVVVLDDLVRRARPMMRAGDHTAAELALEATLRRLDGAADTSERIALWIEVARLRRATGKHREAADACRAALGLDGSSVSAAVLLASVAAEIGDRRAAALAATSLASVTRAPRAKATLLRDAADLSAAQGDAKAAAALLEEALVTDPDSVVIAARLAQIQAKERAWADLSRVLRRCLAKATTAEAIVPMAAELAEVAKNQLNQPLVAIDALSRSREVEPSHVPTLFRLAELYIGQRAWSEALGALGDVVERSDDRDEKLVARAGRASIFARILDRPEDAEKELRAALELDPHDVRALRGLLALRDATAPAERADLLSRVVLGETQRDARLAALLELAQVRRDLGDAAGAEGALVEAAALSPSSAMLDRVRRSASDDETAARVLSRALARAREAGLVPSAEWLATLGELELGLSRFDDAIDHLEQTLAQEPSREASRLSLARALAAKGRHENAAAALGPLLESGSPSLLDAGVVRLLDQTLSGAGRAQQADVARELRAIAGDLEQAGLAKLGARRQPYASNGEALSTQILRSFVMPGARGGDAAMAGIGKHPFWEVGHIALGMAGKLSRVALSDHGSSTRDRVKPRAVHPIRPIFDRMLAIFELVDIELAVSDGVNAPVVACEDAIWVVVPSSLADWPEGHAVAALARPMTRIALGVPWFGSIPLDDVVAIVVAVARQVEPSFAALPADRIEPIVLDYELRARRAIDRKKKKALESLASELATARPILAETVADVVLRTESRAAFLLSSDLRAAMDALAISDPSLADALRVPGPGALSAVLGRPIARDVVSFALGGDATALRRSLGTLWT